MIIHMHTRVWQSMMAVLSSSRLTMPLRPHLLATCSGVIEFCCTSPRSKQHKCENVFTFFKIFTKKRFVFCECLYLEKKLEEEEEEEEFDCAMTLYS